MQYFSLLKRIFRVSRAFFILDIPELAVLQVHGYLFGNSSTEYLKYFRNLFIFSTSVFQVPVFPVL